MAFVIDDAFLPATLTAHPMTDGEFAGFCAEHPDLFFEMTAEGEIIVMPPTYSLTGARSAETSSQLRNWARQDGRGIVCNAASGFALPNGAQLAWLIDPERRSVSIYRPESPVETRTGIDAIAGEGPVAGFLFDLSTVWNPLGD